MESRIVDFVREYVIWYYYIGAMNVVKPWASLEFTPYNNQIPNPARSQLCWMNNSDASFPCGQYL
jgi:hypothetical protein